MINRYRKYLELIDIRLKDHFEAQADFIKCKNGCAYCCKDGEYPLSELEYINLMLYYNTLPSETKGIINQNIENLVKTNRHKCYVCPFLINDSCSVYPARPLICRTFGLISYLDDEKKKLPFCFELGLNYANAYDKDTRLINKCSENGNKPEAYNIDRRILRSKENEKLFDIYFGKDKAMIEWLKEDKSLFEENNQ